MFCKQNFNDNVGHKNLLASSCYLQMYFEHKNRFKVLIFNRYIFLFCSRQNINAEPRKFDIADRHTSFMLLAQLALDKNLSYVN